MKEDTKSDPLRVIDILKDKGLSTDETRVLADYLDQRVLEITQPLVERMDQLEVMFYITLVVILVAPGALGKYLEKLFPGLGKFLNP